MRSLLSGAALGMVFALGACSPGGQTTETTSAAAPPPAVVAEAPPASAAPAAIPVGLIALDVKDKTGKAMSGDPVKGEKIFLQCMVCHSAEEGVNGTGPSLYGIVGRHSGSIPGFRYSDANRNSGITWTEQEMFNYLEDPQKKIPGTIMAFVGLKNAQQRADVIAYLQVNAGKK